MHCYFTALCCVTVSWASASMETHSRETHTHCGDYVFALVFVFVLCPRSLLIVSHFLSLSFSHFAVAFRPPRTISGQRFMVLTQWQHSLQTHTLSNSDPLATPSRVHIILSDRLFIFHIFNHLEKHSGDAKCVRIIHDAFLLFAKSLHRNSVLSNEK